MKFLFYLYKKTKIKNNNSVSLIKNYLFSISLLTILIQIGCKKEIESDLKQQTIVNSTNA